MAASTKSSAGSGRRKSSAGKSTAGAAADSSDPGNPGTSDTTTTIGQSLEALSTEAKTAPRRRTKRIVVSDNDGAPVVGDSVAAGVERDIKRIADLMPELADGALAASARALAKELDDPNSATSKSMCANSLLATMNRLNELLPPKQETSALDDLRARREARRAAARESGT